MVDEAGVGTGCFGIEIRVNTAKLTHVIYSRIWTEMRPGLEKRRRQSCEQNSFNERKVSGDDFLIFASCVLRRNSVLEELKVKRFAVIQKQIC